MVGQVVLREERGRRPALERGEVCGLPLLTAAVPAPPGLEERRLERRIDKAARMLAGAGVRRVLAEPDCPWWPVLADRGLRPVEAEPLVQAMAAPLALALLARVGCPAGEATVALWGRRVGRAMFQTALELFPAVRRLAILAPEGGTELAALLRWEYGVPVLETLEGLEPQAEVCFSPRWDGRPGALELWGPRPDLAGLGLRAEGEERLEVLTLLWESGRLKTGELQVVQTSLP